MNKNLNVPTDKELQEKFDNLNRKFFRALVSGKLDMKDAADKEWLQKCLGIAVRIEEYEAAQMFKNHIDKL